MLNFVAIDFETANRWAGSACAVGVVKVVNGQITAKQYRLINPKSYFLAEFTNNIHGIGEDNVRNASAFDEVWPELFPMLDGADFLVAHNSTFDDGVLKTCCYRYGLQPPGQNFICTLKIARTHWRMNPASLDAACRNLQIDLDHHQALSDATACAAILIHAIHDGYKLKSI